MATINRASTARPGLGDQLPRPTRPAGRHASWWRDWFAPARGLRPRAVDILVALAVAFIQIAGTIVYSQDESSPWALDAYAFRLLLVGPVALLFRRRWPEATLVVAFAAAAGYAASGYPRGPAGFPAFAAAMVSAIMMGRRAFAWGVLAVAYPPFILLPSVNPDEVEEVRGPAGEAASLVWLPLVAADSEIARNRLERRADRAHAARAEARRRASEERLLIARELHDVLAHNISLINVQSGVALHLLDERSEQARSALEAINQASEQALVELRSVLDVLHGGLGEARAHGESGRGRLAPPRRACATSTAWCDGPERSVSMSSWPSRARRGRCPPASTWRRSGSAGGAHQRCSPRRRRRHSQGAVVYGPAELVVQVDDDGEGVRPGAGGSTTAAEGVGRGIAGMRERVHALSGTFTAGPRSDRGFRVQAQFPLQDGAR